MARGTVQLGPHFAIWASQAAFGEVSLAIAETPRRTPRGLVVTSEGATRLDEPSQTASDFLAGGGQMGERMRRLDWSRTGVGEPATWPQSLRTVVRILLTSRFAMWMAWGDDLTFFCNDAYLPTTGVKRDWVLGARSDKVWAEIWPDIGPRIEHVLATGQATWDEALLLYLERSGFVEETYHTFSYSPLADDLGTIVGMLCVVAEVTERVIGERQLDLLRDMGARLSAASTRADVMEALTACLTAGAPDVPFGLVYLVDQETGDARLAAIHGLQPDTPATPSRLALDDPRGPWSLGRAKADAVSVCAPADTTSDLPLTHWQQAPTKALVAPITVSEGGAPVGYFVAGLNPHRAFDASYRGFIELLTGQIAAAIARADEYETAKARAEALSEIDQAKTTFFSNVSHEFRTPLTLMLGPLEDALAQSEDLSPTQRERLEVAHRNGLRLLRLVNALLDFSRIEAGRAQASYRPTDLAALTIDLASSFRSAIERASLKLIVDAPPLSEPVYVDRAMWETIVLNLLSNAFKFTFEGEIAVSLKQQGVQAVLTIRDTGTGIPAEELPRLFERFHRVEGARGRSFEGSGIGLALVKELVAQHGGQISVQSEVGLGTSFIVSLPLGRDHLAAERIDLTPGVAAPATKAASFVQEALRWLPSEPAAETGAEALPNIPTSVASGRQQRIILADDNADLRTYIQRLLEEQGYEVQALGSGEQALAAVRENRPDLLVSDVMMPGLDGFGLLRAIRSDASLRDLPVIFLSARAGEESKVEGLDAGADDYLVKPFSTRELLARVSANIAMARVRREAAETVAAAEARAARVLAQMTEGYILLDREFRVVEINDEGVRMDGRSRDEFIGRSHWDLWPGSEEGAQGRLYQHVVNSDAPGSVEIRYEWPDGRSAWIEVDAFPVPDGVAVFFHDISARKLAEEALRELNATLEKRVDERTRELVSAEEALRQAQKMEAMGQLTGGVAHDFNNLLTPIVGALDMLQRKGIGGEREHRLINGAMQSAERAKTLVQRLLAFARRQPLQPTAVDISKLMADIADLIASTSGPQIRVSIEAAEALPFARADQNQLEMALLNLSVNARDAMPTGGTLRISATQAEVHPSDASDLAPGGYVRLSVSDTGSGMDESTLARATEPFFSTKGVGKGTGLGLSMVHGLAQQLGGALRIQSRKGVGTNVELWLPTTDASPGAEVASANPASAATPAGTVLLVDDEELARTSTAEMLGELGYVVIEVGSSEEAVNQLREGLRPDVLITDHLMPGMNGADLVRLVRSEHKGVKALIVSGFAEAEGVAPDLPRLTKPFRQAELAECLGNLV
jgi:PAS domain S-box-containing protein